MNKLRNIQSRIRGCTAHPIVVLQKDKALLEKRILDLVNQAYKVGYELGHEHGKEEGEKDA